MDEQSKINDIPMTGPVIADTKVQRRSHADKLAQIFLAEDLDRIGTRIMNEAIIPNILDVVKKILHKSVDLMFSPSGSGTQEQVPGAYVTVVDYSKGGSSVSSMQVMNSRSGVYDYSEVRFRSQRDVQNVVDNMRAVIRTQGRVSVGKYLEFANARTIPNDYNYGWTKLDREDVYAQETGDPDYPFRLVLPPAYPIARDNRIYL